MRDSKFFLLEGCRKAILAQQRSGSPLDQPGCTASHPSALEVEVLNVLRLIKRREQIKKEYFRVQFRIWDLLKRAKPQLDRAVTTRRCLFCAHGNTNSTELTSERKSKPSSSQTYSITFFLQQHFNINFNGTFQWSQGLGQHAGTPPSTTSWAQPSTPMSSVCTAPVTPCRSPPIRMAPHPGKSPSFFSTTICLCTHVGVDWNGKRSTPAHSLAGIKDVAQLLERCRMYEYPLHRLKIRLRPSPAMQGC